MRLLAKSVQAINVICVTLVGLLSESLEKMSKVVTLRHSSGREQISFYLEQAVSNLDLDTGCPEICVVLHSTSRNKCGKCLSRDHGRLLCKFFYSTG